MSKILKYVALSALGAIATAAQGSAPPDLTVVEYLHRPSGHYFMTGSPADQALLQSAPVNASFAVTGRSFTAWSSSNAGRPGNAVAVVRFFSPAAVSHVFTSNAADISLLRSMPNTSGTAGFIDEGIAFYALPPSSGRCEQGLRPVFRAFNNRADGNHRYSNELELHAVMVRSGFADEAVAFCTTGIASDANAEKLAGTPRPAGEDLTVTGSVSAFASISSFVVGTQTVDASQARFDNGSAAMLVNGVSISVEGVIVNSVLRATEVKFAANPGSAVSSDEIKGYVTAIGTGGNLFINGHAVDASNAVVTGGTLAQISVGTEVEVHGNFINGVFVARIIHIEDSPSSPPAPGSQGSVEIDGLVTSFTSSADFTVAGQRVDARNAVFEDGTALSLAVGVRVEVHGAVTAGVLVANRVEIKRPRNSTGGDTPSGGFEATGSISGFVSVASFMVSGVSVDASAATFKNGSAADLGNGVVVEVKGNLVNGRVIASSVEIKSGTNPGNPPSGSAFESTGTITDFVSIASFRVGGVQINATNAVFEDGSASSLRNGALVEVHGNLVNGVVQATRIEFKNTPTPPSPGNPPDGTEYESTGNVSAFVSVAAFEISGVKIDASNASFERGTAADLRDGVRIEVRGRYASGKVIANRVRFER